MVIRVNDVEVDDSEWPSPEAAAAFELVRQRAVTLGWLSASCTLDEAEEAVERVLADEVGVPEADESACRRYHAQHASRYRLGDRIEARHILFQVNEGAPLSRIRALAEATLHEMRANPERFAERATERSNCPSGEKGGALGVLQRGESVPEFERPLFDGEGLGVHPELVKTRFGFHVVCVDRRLPGQALAFEDISERVADDLRREAESLAIAQYVRVLAGQASLHGVTLDAASSPLVQ